MAYTETTTTGYGTRIKNSFGGVLVGIVCIIGGTVCLWCNEGRAVHTADDIAEVGDNVVEMQSVDKVDKSFDGKLVWATGMAVSADQLEDASFGISTPATRLVREVKYYQWVEQKSEKKEDKIGGKQEPVTTYTYKKEWTSSPVKSDDFKQEARVSESKTMGEDITNVALGDFKDETYYAANVAFGAYKLPDFLISSITGTQDLEVSITDAKQAELDNAIRSMYKQFGREVVNTTASNAPSANTPSAPQAPAAEADSTESAEVDSVTAAMPTEWQATAYDYIHISGNTVYLGASPSMPQIGDVMIEYSYVPAENEVSIMLRPMATVSSSTSAKTTARCRTSQWEK